MKKLSFILLLLLTSKVWGQDVRQARKGDFLVGGSFSGYYENNQGFEFDHNYSLGLSSNACYFVLNKFATGLSVSVTQEGPGFQMMLFGTKTHLISSPPC